MEVTDLNLLPNKIKDAYMSCSSEERVYLRQILQELADWGESPTYNNIWLADYSEIPVSIDTFLESDTFLGKVTRNGKAVYPAWRTCMRDVFNAGNKFNEVVLTGATRIGKSSTAITMTAYMLYRLMCLRDPQEYFHKKDVSKFSILFFNITKDLAKGVAFREFNDTLRTSPWFCSHGRFSKSEENFYYIPDGGKISIDYGSDASHGLGKQVFVGLMDECSFAKAGVKDVNKAKEHMKSLYDTISARIKGTFRQNGEVYGKLFAISSKKSDSDFMEYYVSTKLAAGGASEMYIFDKPQWEVLPKSMFSDKTFYIAVGSKNQKGFVVPPEQENEEALDELRSQGFTILEPPIDMMVDFKSDFDIALRDLAGISVPGTLSYITKDTVKACINYSRRNPFYNSKISLGTKDTFTIEEFFHLDAIDPLIKRCPMYIHMDLSLNECNSGLSGICISGRKDILDADGKVISHPCFTHVFSLAIEAPRGDQIPYQKIVNFIVWLRRQGFNIAGVSRDQYQSEYVGQQLVSAGFDDSKVSLDRTPDPYLAFRSILLEQRIDLLECEILEDELIHLQRDSLSGKVDHPVGGSKDVSDSVAGAVWNAIIHNPSIPIQPAKVAKAIKSVNSVHVSRQTPESRLPSMVLGKSRNSTSIINKTYK